MTAQGEAILAYLDSAITAREELAQSLPAGPWTARPDDDVVVAADLISVAEAFALSSRQTRAVQAHIALHDPKSVLRRCAADRKIVDLYTATKRLAEHDDDPNVIDLLTAARQNLRALESVVQSLAEGYGWTEGDR
ncbi:DUF6221 family protein [Streptomyces sp. NPDC047515]|uniref:DUF6221 family protein n=1 Tax=Streptomyces sp. NPDC047515 TaxID=3155380 RepID=UPI0033EF07A5